MAVDPKTVVAEGEIRHGFLIDCSTSMSNYGRSAGAKEALLRSLRTLLTIVSDEIFVSVYIFSKSVFKISDWTLVSSDLARQYMEAPPLPLSSGTALFDSLWTIINEWPEDLTDDTVNCINIINDGRDTHSKFATVDSITTLIATKMIPNLKIVIHLIEARRPDDNLKRLIEALPDIFTLIIIKDDEIVDSVEKSVSTMTVRRTDRVFTEQ